MFRPVLALILICLGGCRATESIVRTPTKHFSHIPDSVQAISPGTPIELPEAKSIEDYVQLGLARNPDIHAAIHRMDALRFRIPQVNALPDPKINTTTHLAPVQTAAGEQAFALGVSQTFTNSNRRAAQTAIISDEIDAAEAALKDVQLAVAANIRSACFQLLFIRKSIDITREDLQSLEQISDVIQRQYEVKKSVTQQDVLNVQSELSTTINQLTELEQKEKSYQARLARLIRLEPGSKVLISDKTFVNSPTLDLESLIAQASQFRPDLIAQFAAIRRNQKQTVVARLAHQPDFTLGLNWIATSASGISPVANGDDAFLLGFGFNLPINQSKIRAGICEAQSNQLAAESRLLSLQDKATEEVFDLVAKIESNRETLTVIQEEIIPRAGRSLDISLEEYVTGSIEYAQLMANWRSLLRFRINEASLQSQQQQLLAKLARSVGQLNPLQQEDGTIDSTR